MDVWMDACMCRCMHVFLSHISLAINMYVFWMSVVGTYGALICTPMSIPISKISEVVGKREIG